MHTNKTIVIYMLHGKDGYLETASLPGSNIFKLISNLKSINLFFIISLSIIFTGIITDLTENLAT